MDSAPLFERSRARAVFYAAGLALFVGCGAVITFFTLATRSTWAPGIQDGMGGSLGLMVTMLPGTIMLGMIFAFPSALVMTVTMASLMRQQSMAGRPLAWGLAGIVVAAPIAWLFGAMFDEKPFDVLSVHMVMLAIGFASGLAGRWGYREMPLSASKA